MRSPLRAPDYALYRLVTVVDPAGILTEEGRGLNCGLYTTINIKVVPLTGTFPKEDLTGATLGTSNPNVEVLFWDPFLKRFVKHNPAQTLTGLGAGAPYEFEVACNGRKILISVTNAVVGGETVAIFASGFEHQEFAG